MIVYFKENLNLYGTYRYINYDNYDVPDMEAKTEDYIMMYHLNGTRNGTLYTYLFSRRNSNTDCAREPIKGICVHDIYSVNRTINQLQVITCITHKQKKDVLQGIEKKHTKQTKLHSSDSTIIK